MRAAHRLGQVGGLLPRHRAAARARAPGPALIVSPLLALMRNQIAAAERLGIRAHTINSTNREAWEEVRAAAGRRRGRPAADQPRAAQQPAVPRRRCCRCSPSASGCSWSTRRTASPTGATTSGRTTGASPTCSSGCPTASPCSARPRPRTTASSPTWRSSCARARRGRAAADLPRAARARAACAWRSSSCPAQADRLAWLATWLPQLEGSGIVYTLTKRDADLVAGWLTGARDRARRPTAARSRREQRVAVEERLLANDLKAVVATSALGMGYDKPDLGFVVHYQAPGSVIAYYQQVGRAGRGVEHADVVLLRGAEDRRIQDFFIEQAFPRRELVDRVLEALDAAGEDGLVAARAQRRREPRPRADRGDAQGARRRGRGGARRQPLGAAPGARLALRRRALRGGHRAAPARAGGDGGVRRRRPLPDARAAGGARRPRAARLRPLLGLRRRRASTARSTRSSCAQAALHLRSQAARCSRSRRWRRREDGAMRKIPEDVRAEEGRALARLGDGGWDPLVQAGPPRGALRRRARRRRGRGGARLGRRPSRGSTAVPSRRSGALVPDFARAARGARSASRSRRRSSATGDGPPQREMANSAQQVANVRGAVRGRRRRCPPGPCLLVDDVRFSGWTLAMLAGPAAPPRRRRRSTRSRSTTAF